MWLEETPIIHVLDTHTKFQNATVLRGKKSSDVLQEFVECYTTLYNVYSDIIGLDLEAGFIAASFRDLATTHGIILQISEAQSHNRKGFEEKYQESFRRVFRILRSKHPTLELEIALK